MNVKTYNNNNHNNNNNNIHINNNIDNGQRPRIPKIIPQGPSCT